MFLVRLQYNRYRRAVSIEFLNWSPSWHIWRLWFTDNRAFRRLVDEEIEKRYEKRRTDLSIFDELWKFGEKIDCELCN
jgi:hypothetical protein